MATAIDYAVLFTKILDGTLNPALTTGFMAGNANQVQHLGAGEFKFAKKKTSGLGAYSNADGYNAGDFSLEWETRKVEQLRSVTFNIPQIEMDEAGIEFLTEIMTDFQNEHVVPEVDSFRYKTIFEYAARAARITAYAPVTSTVYSELKNNLTRVRNTVGRNVKLALAISESALNVLEQSDKIQRTTVITDGKTALTTAITGIDNVEVIPVPDERMKTEFNFSATNGFGPAGTALPINWVIMSKSDVIAPVAVDETRVFDPKTNQKARAWKIDYMVYHDLWILDNKVATLLVSINATAAAALTATIAAGTAVGTTKATITPDSGDTLAYCVTKSAGTMVANVAVSGLTVYTSGADIAAEAGQYLNIVEFTSAGRVKKFISYQLAVADIKA